MLFAYFHYKGRINHFCRCTIPMAHLNCQGVCIFINEVIPQTPRRTEAEIVIRINTRTFLVLAW